MRVIPRTRVGEATRQVRTLMRGLDPKLFHQRLYVGSPTSDLDGLAALSARIRQYRPDVLHTHSGRAGDLGRIAAAWQGVPIRVHTFHEDLPYGAAGIHVGAQRFLARRGDRLIAVSAKVRDGLLARGIGRPEQYEVIPPGLSLGPLPDRANARRLLGLAGRGPVVAVVGPVAAAKRLDRMLAVAEALRTSVTDVQFVVAGEGDELTATANASATQRLGVAFLGWRIELETLYAAADVVLLTSDHEGVPACVIEAGMAGRPVVATDVGGVSDVVRHGETGLLAARDVDAIASCLLRLLRDDRQRHRMGRAAQAATTRRFGGDRFVADMTAVYRELAVARGRWPRPEKPGPLSATPSQGVPTADAGRSGKVLAPATATGTP